MVKTKEKESKKKEFLDRADSVQLQLNNYECFHVIQSVQAGSNTSGGGTKTVRNLIETNWRVNR